MVFTLRSNGTQGFLRVGGWRWWGAAVDGGGGRWKKYSTQKSAILRHDVPGKKIAAGEKMALVSDAETIVANIAGKTAVC